VWRNWRNASNLRFDTQAVNTGGSNPSTPTSFMKEKYVYVLLADGDGTMRSSDTPFGVAVDTEEEAKRYVKEGKVGYTHSYAEVRVFSDSNEGIKWAFSKRGPMHV
jgi:hypothetical protein